MAAPARRGVRLQKCAATECQAAAVSSGESAPLNGSKVQTIQKMIAAGGVDRMSNSGPSVVRTNSTAGLSLPQQIQMALFSLFSCGTALRLFIVVQPVLGRPVMLIGTGPISS